MLHGNVSRNGYGNAMIGRYGGCFEEDIMWLMCERAYRLMDFDEAAKFVAHLEVRCNKEARKYKDIGGSARNRILALV